MGVLWIPGQPVPQGSMKAFGSRVIHSRSKELMAWRSLVADACSDFTLIEKTQGVHVSMKFILLKPKSAKRAMPTVRPDLDKLVRSVGDAVTGIAFEDDSQIVSLTAQKVYGPEAGLFLEVLPL